MIANKYAYRIRWAKENDWSHVMEMVWKTFLKFEGNDYTQEGIKNFYDFITDTGLYQAFLRGEYQMLVAEQDQKIVGMASVRCGNHLSLLFVDEVYHHKGIGRDLMLYMCNYLKAEVGERYMSVKASPYAVNFYKKLGFHALRPEE